MQKIKWDLSLLTAPPSKQRSLGTYWKGPVWLFEGRGLLQINSDESKEIALVDDMKLDLGRQVLHINGNRCFCAATLENVGFCPSPSFQGPCLSHHPLCQGIQVSPVFSPGHCHVLDV